MQTLVASNDEQAVRRIQELLAAHGVECPAGYAVTLESAADRADRLAPDLLVLVLPSDPVGGLEALREICRAAQGVHRLVVGPADDAKLILRTLREGADEYLDESILDTELAAALSRLKAGQNSRRRPSQLGRTIAVLAPSGGSGSSTLAVNLSVSLAKHAGECGLIDLRLDAGDLASMLDLKPQHTLADLCDCLTRVDHSMFEQLFARHRSGVHLLAAPGALAAAKPVSSKGVRQALMMARVKFPYVVADVDRSLGAEQVETLWHSDVILLVLRLDYTSLRNVRRTMNKLVELGIGLERVQVVVNGYGQARQLALSEAEEALGVKIAHCVPHDPARVNWAVNKGIPVVLQRPFAKVSKRIRTLAISLNGRAKRR